MTVAPRAVHVFIDNLALDGFTSEWGLSLGIDLDTSADHGPLWLLDTGNSDTFIANARGMGVDPGRAQGLVLSHGHYDHTSGLPALLSDTAFSGVIRAHPDCAMTRYNTSKDVREIGIPTETKAVLDFIPAHGTEELAPGLFLLTDIPRRPGNFEAVEGFSFDTEGTHPDPVEDDAFLVLHTPRGPVAVLGCCHSGLTNSLQHMRDELGIHKLHAVIGGLHLYKASDEALKQAAKTIEEFQVECVVPGHCSGERGFTFLKKRLACEVRSMAAGQTLTFA